MKRQWSFYLTGAAALLFVLYNALFIVDEAHQALVFQFGEIKKTYQTAGMKAKIPFIQEVVLLEKRIMEYEKPSFNITLLDQKRLVVDVYALFRIKDPLAYFKAVGDERTARARLDEVVPGTLKAVMGGFNLSQIISEDRAKTLGKLLVEVNRTAHGLGIEVVDARIRRSDLPPENSKSIFARMKSERQRAAREIRAQGEELAREIRATVEKEQTILLAEAEKTAQLIRGKAEAEAIKIFAEAVNKDPKFYQFYRSMEAYKTAFHPETTTFILSPKNDFFKFFSSNRGTGAP